MKNVGEVIEKMNEIAKVKNGLEYLHSEFREKTDEWHVEPIKAAQDLLDEYVVMLRGIKVNA